MSATISQCLPLLLVLAATLSGVRAKCSNLCSGHGACGANDICNCYRGYYGSDCSQRRCPYKRAWADAVNTALHPARTPHHYAECANKGECNTDTGVCDCLAGYTGSGCSRMQCPEDCNHVGTCVSISDANPAYVGWDQDAARLCLCDPGYTGTACELRVCKPGDDVLTQNDPLGNLQVSEIQTLKLVSDQTDLVGTFTIRYTDWRGEVLETWPLDVTTVTSIAVKEALEALPNHAVPTVTVAAKSVANGVSFTVDFDDAGTTGDQQALTLHTDGCALHGCQPYYVGLTTNGVLTATVTETRVGTTEAQPCSNRGRCDGESGICECDEGYYGEACAQQTVVL